MRIAVAPVPVERRQHRQVRFASTFIPVKRHEVRSVADAILPFVEGNGPQSRLFFGIGRGRRIGLKEERKKHV